MKFKLNLSHRDIPDNILLADLCRVAKELGKESITLKEYRSHGKYNYSTITRRFKTWESAIKMAGLKKHIHGRIVPEDVLLTDLRRVAKEFRTNSVTREEYEKSGKHATNTFESRFGGWNNALARAGLEINLKRNISEEELFENLENIWIKLGRQPKSSEVSRPLSKYSHVTYSARYGTWNKALEKFIDYVNSEKDEALIVENAPPQGTPNEEPANLETERPPRLHKTRTHRTKRSISTRLRFLVMRRDSFKCQICGRSPAKNPAVELHVDHIKAWAEGGETVSENLQTLCSVCNIGKSNLEM